MTDPEEMTPAEIKALRKKFGMTQAKLAAILGYGSKTRIAELEAGTFAPGPAVIRLLRAYLEGYRPRDWPPIRITVRYSEPFQSGPLYITTTQINAYPEPPNKPRVTESVSCPVARLPATPETIAKVRAAMKRGTRTAGAIAREIGLGLMTVQEAMAAMDAMGPPASPPRKA